MRPTIPSPNAPAEYRGPLKPIPTAVPGVQVSELLPNHARLLDKVSLIRSLHHDNGDHFAAAHWMLTGYLGANGSNQTPKYPSAGSIIARLKGARKPGMPAYVGLPHTHSVGIAPGYHGAAYLGSSFNPFNADGDPGSERYRVPNLTLPSGVDSRRVDGRRGLLGQLDQARCSFDSSGITEGFDHFEQEAFSMVLGQRAREAFDLHKEDPRLRDRYSRHQWGQSALLARRLVEAGVRFVTLTFGGWDFHSSLEKGMHRVLPILDAAVGSLIEDLETRGLLDSTMVIVMGEFGRTPRMNKKGVPGSDPVPGRDHWGNVMSVLVAGGGFARTGRRRIQRPRRTSHAPARCAPGPDRHTIPPAWHRSPDDVRQPHWPAGDDWLQRAGDLGIDRRLITSQARRAPYAPGSARAAGRNVARTRSRLSCGDELERDFLGADRLALAVVGAAPEFFAVHGRHHVQGPLVALGLALREHVQVRDLGRR